MPSLPCPSPATRNGPNQQEAPATAGNKGKMRKAGERSDDRTPRVPGRGRPRKPRPRCRAEREPVGDPARHPDRSDQAQRRPQPAGE